MCVDTPAASYDLAGTEYTFYMNPHVAKDFTDAFILKIASEYLPKVGRPWHEKEFTTGTDTYLAEPMVGVPTVWGYSGSGVETHHNSEDTPDRVDERSLRDISVIDAAFLYFIANAGEPEALWLARLSESRGYEQILKSPRRSSIGWRAPRTADARGQLLAEAEAKIAYSVDRESQAVSSVLRLVPESRRSAVKASLQPMLEGLRRFGEMQSGRARDAAGGVTTDRGSRPANARGLEDRRQAQTVRNAAAGRSGARAMGRLSVGRLGRHPDHRSVLVRRTAEPGGSGPSDAVGTRSDRFRFCRLFSFSRATRLRGDYRNETSAEGRCAPRLRRMVRKCSGVANPARISAHHAGGRGDRGGSRRCRASPGRNLCRSACGIHLVAGDRDARSRRASTPWN